LLATHRSATATMTTLNSVRRKGRDATQEVLN
jgi:hypothetical protein